MKNLFVLISSLTFFVVFSANLNAKTSLHSATVEDSIYVWTSPDLFDIATTWVSAYESINPEAKINISKISGDMVNHMTDKSGNIGLITKDYLPSANKSIWKMAIGRDIIVPIMNSENPFLEEIFQKGISQEEFASVFTDIKRPTWGILLNNKQSIPVNCYYISNESNKSYLTDFLQTDPTELKGKNVNDINEMLSKIHNDKYAIGYCKLVDILDFENQELKEGISLIPIDINGNDKVDLFENIYNNSNALERGVWIGKYPKVLYSNIYSVAGDQPINSNELAFLEWIVTDGQQHLNSKGYSKLLIGERQRKVKSLYDNPTTMVDVQKPANTATSTIIIVLIITGVLLTPIVLMYRKSKNPTVTEDKIITPQVFRESSITVPNGMFFDKSHTWAFMEKDGFVRIGIADFLQHVTGQITNVKMKSSGEEVKKGKPFLALIQHGKQLDINSPVSGKIKEINTQLNFNTSAINSSPYSEGWIYTIESTNWLTEIKTFLMGESYKEWLRNEFARLKDFFSSAIKVEVKDHLQAVIQDGGEISDNPMESFGPEIWEEFQTEFINKVK
jgi:glycine cleavage system H lipoate-binding protein/ABC-type phosphate transport system substrate-binding protein